MYDVGDVWQQLEAVVMKLNKVILPWKMLSRDEDEQPTVFSILDTVNQIYEEVKYDHKVDI